MGEINPRLRQFIQGAIAGGFGVDKVVDYFRERSEAPGKAQTKQNLSQQRQKGTASGEELNLLKSLNDRQRGEMLKKMGPVLGGLASMYQGRGGPSPMNPSGAGGAPPNMGGPQGGIGALLQKLPQPIAQALLAKLQGGAQPQQGGPPGLTGPSSPIQLGYTPSKVPDNAGRVKSLPGAPLSLDKLRDDFQKHLKASPVELEKEFGTAMNFIKTRIASGRSAKEIANLLRQLGKNDPMLKRAAREIPQAVKMPLQKFIESMMIPGKGTGERFAFEQKPGGRAVPISGLESGQASLYPQEQSPIQQPMDAQAEAPSEFAEGQSSVAFDINQLNPEALKKYQLMMEGLRGVL